MSRSVHAAFDVSAALLKLRLNKKYRLQSHKALRLQHSRVLIDNVYVDQTVVCAVGEKSFVWKVVIDDIQITNLELFIASLESRNCRLQRNCVRKDFQQTIIM
ncbi:hypothetical protein L1987_11405 [Smallanthus sonchifolius]|uniref:Uncharacterized protein n=1 Tax=Smallanthus sonchifolius TaxID=185202 RepID=A0ACB9JBQ5_9ASTR|nr:hypothetical protein L1987_11405 [Smallanthus sonchifolius]